MTVRSFLLAFLLASAHALQMPSSGSRPHRQRTTTVDEWYPAAKSFGKNVL